jgi:hypothetical protein
MWPLTIKMSASQLTTEQVKQLEQQDDGDALSIE